jgi:hypothetical protein
MYQSLLLILPKLDIFSSLEKLPSILSVNIYLAPNSADKIN